MQKVEFYSKEIGFRVKAQYKDKDSFGNVRGYLLDNEDCIVHNRKTQKPIIVVSSGTEQVTFLKK